MSRYLKRTKIEFDPIVEESVELPRELIRLRDQYRAAGATYTDAIALAVLELATPKPARKRGRR